MPDSFHLKGKNFPDPADPIDRVCFQIEIPDAIQYRAALMGQIDWLADWRCWRHNNIDYTDPPDVNREIAALFAEAISLSKFEACMTACEVVAQCLIDGDEELIAALAAAISTNPLLIQAVASATTSAGSGIPGEPLSPAQSAADFLPDNIRDEFGDCLPDELWGGMLYLVQSGNRVITDFFEVIEVASNTLESMEIVSRAIPAAGDYIATVAAFANKIQEFFAEAYSGAYTEGYEQSLACDLFCTSRGTCELSPADIMQVINGRLTAPMGIADFGEIMVGVASGTWVGDEIADVMFLIFFGALIFGQQFGDTIGIRPLNVIVSLGADQLSSDNWLTLCDCPEVGCIYLDSTNGLDTVFTPSGGLGAQAAWTGTGYGANSGVATARISLHGNLGASVEIESIRLFFDIAATGGGIDATDLYSSGFAAILDTEPNTTEITLGNAGTRQEFDVDVVTSAVAQGGGAVPILGEINRIEIRYVGDAPPVGDPC